MRYSPYLPILSDEERHNNHHRRVLYLIGIFLGFSVAITAYIQSSFLKTFMPENYVGLVFIFSAAITLFAVNYFTAIISRLGNLRTTIIVFILNIISLLILADGYSPISFLIGFVIYSVTVLLIYINLDVFLEHFSTDGETGSIRGIYWTLVNIGWVLGPIFSGWLLDKYSFSVIFTVTIFPLLLVLFLILIGFGRVDEKEYRHPKFFQTFKQIINQKNLRNIFTAAFLLQFFYSWMVIYTPIYLHDVVQLPWSHIGIVFSIMLIPFVLVEYPAGWLADKYLGEKELLITGFLIMSLVTFSLYFVASADIAVWAALLFGTRIGASLIEIMRDTYFFKQISVEDVNLINFFRNTQPLAYIIAPAIASLIITFWPIGSLFIILSVIVLSGVYFAAGLRDTK